jgi:hypothetical protein
VADNEDGSQHMAVGVAKQKERCPFAPCVYVGVGLTRHVNSVHLSNRGILHSPHAHSWILRNYLADHDRWCCRSCSRTFARAIARCQKCHRARPDIDGTRINLEGVEASR